MLYLSTPNHSITIIEEYYDEEAETTIWAEIVYDNGTVAVERDDFSDALDNPTRDDQDTLTMTVDLSESELSSGHLTDIKAEDDDYDTSKFNAAYGGDLEEIGIEFVDAEVKLQRNDIKIEDEDDE